MSKSGATGWVAKKGRWALNSRVWIGADNPAGPMLERWRLFQTPWFGIYVHFIHREDLDRVVHDHPWTFTSFVLKGRYIEDFHADVRWVNKQMTMREHKRWSVHRFLQHQAHRIVWVAPGTTTLCIVGRKSRQWGFYDTNENADTIFVPWQEADLYGLRNNEGPAGSRPAGTPQLPPRWQRDGDGGTSFEPNAGRRF